MTPEILASLKREGDMPKGVSKALGDVVKAWRDRLQTEDARAAMTDDLALDGTDKVTPEKVKADLATWLGSAKAAWLAHTDAVDDVELQAKALAAIAEDTLSGWPGAHDTVGASGVTSACEAVGDTETLAACLVAARVGGWTEETVERPAGPMGEEAGPVVVRTPKEHDAPVAGLQASLRAVLVGLCG